MRASNNRVPRLGVRVAWACEARGRASRVGVRVAWACESRGRACRVGVRVAWEAVAAACVDIPLGRDGDLQLAVGRLGVHRAHINADALHRFLRKRRQIRQREDRKRQRGKKLKAECGGGSGRAAQKVERRS
eukprot:6214036-Pleurochrysis_carterae.AAC.5